jgi:hypothetical protein
MKRIYKNSATLLIRQTCESQTLKMKKKCKLKAKLIQQNSSRKLYKSLKSDRHPDTGDL